MAAPVGLRPIPLGGIVPAMSDSVLVPAYHDSKDEVLKRLRRVEGQIRGLQRMVDEDTYCIDVLTQVSAATRALQSVAVNLLDQHLRHCVADAISKGDDVADARLTEATQAIDRLVRS